MKSDFFQFRRAFAIGKKEFAHISRDKFTLVLALGLPLVIVLVFGVAIEFSPSDIPTAVLDQDKTQASRQLIETWSSSRYFVSKSILSFSEVRKQLESEKSKTVIVIPPKFERDLLSGRNADVQVLVNAADNSSAGPVLSYLGQIEGMANKRLLGRELTRGVQLESRYLFNPELNSKWFTVPGLMVIIMTMIAIMLTALTVAKEWEFGSMELLLSTPVNPLKSLWVKSRLMLFCVWGRSP